MVVEGVGMSERAQADYITVRGDLLKGLARYAEEARAPYDEEVDEIAATQAWLDERLRIWQAIAERCQEEVAELTSLLRRCQLGENIEVDDVERGLHEAVIRLGAAQDELASVRRWTLEVSEVWPQPARPYRNAPG